jgi:uncharacterized integral membrane protein (TIGR00698 family)
MGVVVTAADPSRDPQAGRARLLAQLVFGLAACAAIAVIAMQLRRLPGLSMFSPMILAVIVGIATRAAVGMPTPLLPGVRVAVRPVLRLGIILLGLQVTLAQIGAVGLSGLAILAIGLAVTFVVTRWLGVRMGIESELATLIAAGTSVCGASAVMATSAVVRAREADVAYAVACVTLFGSLAMLIYPMIGVGLGLSPQNYGLWAGASIHEIAQVVAAAFQGGPAAGEFGTVSKLGRVMMLAPLVLLLGFGGHADADGVKVRAPMPWFLFGFLALVVVNSLVPPPVTVKQWLIPATAFLLSMALAAMGLQTDLRALYRRGVRPLALGALSTLLIAGLTLVLILLRGLVAG